MISECCIKIKIELFCLFFFFTLCGAAKGFMKAFKENIDDGKTLGNRDQVETYLPSLISVKFTFLVQTADATKILNCYESNLWNNSRLLFR